MKSASAWHGCSKSESAFTTGTRELAAISVIVSCAYVRSTITSTQRSTFFATSAIDSRSPSGELVWSTKIALPPIVLMPVSKLSRVRRLAFSNISTICLASRAVRYSRGFRFTSCPSFNIARTSPLDKSAIEQRSSPASRAAAASTSGSFCTGTPTSRRSIVLLTMLVSSCGCRGTLTGRILPGCKFCKDFVQRCDCCIHMRALQYEWRQEPQHRVAGAIDQDVPFQHLRHRPLAKLCGIEFRRNHQSLAPHIPNRFMLLFEAAQPLLEVVAYRRRIGQQSVPLDCIDHGYCNRACQRPASKCSPVHSGVEQPSQRQPERHHADFGRHEA